MYRYILALLVVLFHLVPGSGVTGPIAVFSFYLLSGYLMALVLQTRYGFGRKGFQAYLLNRALRIFPPYWAVFALSWALIYFMPLLSQEVCYNCILGGDLLSNLKIFGRTFTLIGAHRPYTSPVVVPAWSLHVEFFFYILMGLALCRNKTISLAWLGASLAATAAMLFTGSEWEYLFFSKLGGSLPFALGSTLYFFREKLHIGRLGFWAAAATFVFSCLLVPLWGETLRVTSLYLSLGASIFLVIYLIRVRPKTMVPPAFARLDRILGDLSYPIFLMHYQVAIMVYAVLPRHLVDTDAKLFLWILVPLHLLSFLLHALLESPVNKIRDRVRARAVQSQSGT